jgi:hypothetical protein
MWAHSQRLEGARVANYPISFNDSHLVTIDPEKKGSKCGSVDNA